MNALCPLAAAVALWLTVVVGAADLVAATTAARPDFLPWRRYQQPAFPLALTKTLVKDGFAVVAFIYDQRGHVIDRVALRASHPAFAVAVFEAMQDWEIDTSAASSTAENFPKYEIITFNFVREGYLISLTQREAAETTFDPYGDESATPVRTVTENQLDPPLHRLTAANPEYPPALKTRGVRGAAKVRFVVDAEGRVRVPFVLAATEPEFGAAALVAVWQWTFSPPHLGTLPAQAVVERTFRFGASEEKK